MNLIIDIGNSYLKLSVFELNKLIYFQKKKTEDLKKNINDILKLKDIKYSIISSVVQVNHDLFDAVQKISLKTIILDHHTPIPIKNLYKTPETLGKDRLAGIVGAYNIYKHHNVLAIDAGTALKFDFINKEAEYLGGNISPGLNMRFQALNYFTDKLPMLEKKDFSDLFGTSTEEAIIAGVQNGIIYEIDACIDKFKKEYADLKVILTGGDTFFFAHKLKNTIFAEPKLVSIGLNYILDYNVR